MNIRTSAIAGSGVFTTKAYAKGDRVLPLRGRIVFYSHQRKSELGVGELWVGAGKNLWIDPFPPGRFLNHSCDPNMGFKTVRNAFAVRDIGVGEELTFDYSTTESVTFWSMRCACGSARCRGTVRSVHFLNPADYRQKIQYIPNYFKKLYRNNRCRRWLTPIN